MSSINMTDIKIELQKRPIVEFLKVLESRSYHLYYDDEDDTWEIIDTLDEDGYHQSKIKHADKDKAIQTAYEFILKYL